MGESILCISVLVIGTRTDRYLDMVIFEERTPTPRPWVLAVNDGELIALAKAARVVKVK